jgi:hypothetical protein
MLSIVLFILAIPHVASSAEPQSVSVTLAQLRELKPLPKVHYSWPAPWEKLDDDLLYEYVRLTHAISVAGEWTKQNEIDLAVNICQKVNATKPKIPASIGINYSVWHRRFGKDLPPTDIGPTHQQELDYLTSRMQTVRDAVDAANKKRGANVVVSAVLFDSERFQTKPGDEVWNKAIDDKYNAAYDIVRSFFPDVRIEWYGRGGIHPGASPTGWSEANYFSLNEKGETFGCSLYSVPEIGYTREIYKRTAANAAQHGCDEVTPWIALASGYRRRPDKFHEFSMDWNYDLIYSWQLGAEINVDWYGVPERSKRFAPWTKAKIAIFYPEPFGREPYWGEHFVSYVRGANDVKSLPGE